MSDLRTSLLHELTSNRASYVQLPEHAEKVHAALVAVVELHNGATVCGTPRQTHEAIARAIGLPE